MKTSEQNKKPVAKVIGSNGNVFNLMGICSRSLKEAGMKEAAKEMMSKIFASKNYHEALNIMSDYCTLQ